MSKLSSEEDAHWKPHAVVSSSEMRTLEELAHTKGMSFSTLMEHAGQAAAKIIRSRYNPLRTLVLCGPGNNGGDGYVCAETLRRAGWDVTVAALKPKEEMTGIAALAAQRWQGPTINLTQVNFKKCRLIIDALFGTGLSRPLDEAIQSVIDKIALTSNPVIALDLPSGIDASTGELHGHVAKANLTIAFGRKKCGHLLLPGARFCGDVVVADIGIHKSIFRETRLLTAENVPGLWGHVFPFPKPEDHKYSRGHALVYGGALMTGAGRLATRAAQRIGVGLVTIAADSQAAPLYSQSLESAIIRVCDSTSLWKEMIDDSRRTALLIGPGLGRGPHERELTLAALSMRKMAVIDADAISNFADDPNTLLTRLHDKCVLTPHEGEFARLFGHKINAQHDKLTRARQAAALAKCVILLKGADTVIAAPDGRAIINANAPPWLATAGSGDVLAGMILGLLAQNMPPFLATAAVAWLHGQIASDFGPGLIAEDLVDGIPHGLRQLLATLTGTNA